MFSSNHLPLQKPQYWHHEARMVGRGKLLKETRGERQFHDDLGAKSDRNEAWRPMREVVSVAVLWATFPLQTMQSVQMFASRTGWLDPNYVKLQPGGSMRPLWINYPEYLSIVNEGSQISLIEWLLRGTLMDSEGNFPENTEKRD